METEFNPKILKDGVYYCELCEYAKVGEEVIDEIRQLGSSAPIEEIKDIFYRISCSKEFESDGQYSLEFQDRFCRIRQFTFTGRYEEMGLFYYDVVVDFEKSKPIT